MPESTAPVRTDTPATALGPTALVFGVLSAVGAWVPALVWVTLPWAILAGALAVTFGVAAIHYARQGIGRMWTAVAGTALGGAGFAGTVTLLWALGA
ncbi:hypothetical protein [Streptomyces sp. NPDC046862]|uniref:hypothetical protein n=1 Tax=Streptomyces sp. NPDC046862 TaxID=3154603 RepID=UPI0034534318